MTQRITVLKAFPSVKEAYAKLEPLYGRFLKTHRRSEKVDLTLSCAPKPKRYTRNLFAGPVPEVEVRCRFTEENRPDMEWFRNEINK